MAEAPAAIVLAAHAIASVADPVTRELVLLAAMLFLIGGIDDMLVDLVFAGARRRDVPLAALPPPVAGRLAIFVPAWREERVIGAMLRRALDTVTHDDFILLVGCYPNDPATCSAIATVAAQDGRVRQVIVPHAGPTTKADCLNALWRALLHADAADERHTLAVILHDAEDVIDAHELTVHAALLRDHALVQVPVVPLVDPAARWISGHYADEFADAHGRQLVARAALGAALPLAGVGCAIRRDALERLAQESAGGDCPFDADSLTEDYELGLRCGAWRLRTCFARVRGGDGHLVATRAYFPGTIATAVRQKARWMTGIAFAGWDRTGWGGRASPAEWWMRMRDRRAPLAVVALLAGYGALVAWATAFSVHAIAGTDPPPFAPAVDLLLRVNAALLAWRLAARAFFTSRTHGWRQGLMSVPRLFVANIIAMMAARRALVSYVRSLAGVRLTWDKTTHSFPDAAALR